MRRARYIWWPLWSRLREVGNSPAIRLTIAIPVVGYLVLLNSKLSSYLDLFTGEWSAPTRLMSIYFGLCFLAVGSVIYAWKCPREVKDHASSTRFIASDFESISTLRRREIHAWVKEYAPGEYRRLERELPGGSVEHIPEGMRRDFYTDVYELYYRTKDSSERYYRIATTIAYIVGFMILAIPSGEVFIQVVGRLWRAVWT